MAISCKCQLVPPFPSPGGTFGGGRGQERALLFSFSLHTTDFTRADVFLPFASLGGTLGGGRGENTTNPPACFLPLLISTHSV